MTASAPGAHPGSDEAVLAGCTCRSVTEGPGRVLLPPAGWFITIGCPVHDPRVLDAPEGVRVALADGCGITLRPQFDRYDEDGIAVWVVPMAAELYRAVLSGEAQMSVQRMPGYTALEIRAGR